MKSFQNILVVMSGKDHGTMAVARAAELARQNSAKLTLVDVVEPLPPVMDVPGSDAERRHNALVSEKLANLDLVAVPLRGEGIVVTYLVLQGSPAERIVAEVFKRGCDLVIKTAEEPDGLLRRLFGTTGLRLLRNCPCPVWIIKAAKESRFEKVLAAVDPRPVGQDRDPQNIKILQLATAIAENDGSELHVVHVFPYRTGTDALEPGEAAESQVKDGRRETLALQKSMLHELIAPYQKAGQIDQVHFLQGNPGNEIAKLTESLHVELLVMGSVGRTSMRDFLIGNTAERVLDQVDCSVLTIKPDDFVSALRS